MLYWLYYYFNRYVGEWALATDGTAPYYQPKQGRLWPVEGPLTPVLATLSTDERKIYLLIANGSWSHAVPCRIRLQNLQVSALAEGVVLTNEHLDGPPLLESEGRRGRKLTSPRRAAW